MSKSGPLIAATIITVLFVIGIIGITGAILIALIYNIIAHPSDISTAGYVLIGFIVYSVWLCYKILHWNNKKTKEKQKQKLSTKEKPVEKPSLSDRFSRFMSGFWVCLLLVTLNGIVLSGVYASTNWIVTLSTADRYEAEITGMKVTTSDNHSRHRKSNGISFSHSTNKTSTPIVRFQSKEGVTLERELYFISGDKLEIGSKLPVYYSSLTDQTIYKSTFAYGIVAVVTLIFLFLLMMSLALFSYALLGKVPDWMVSFWNQIKLRLFYIVMFLGLVGMTCFLGNLIFEWLFDESENQLPGIAITFCAIIFVGCLIGGTGMIFVFFGKKPASTPRNSKKRKKK